MATLAFAASTPKLPVKLVEPSRATTLRSAVRPATESTEEGALGRFGAARVVGTALVCTGTRARGSRSQLGGRNTRCKLKAVASSPEFLLESPPPELELDPEDPTAFAVGILGDLHIDPRDLDHTYAGRTHMNTVLDAQTTANKFVVSLGDLGESKDCTATRQLYSGTTPCFNLAREYLDGFSAKFDVVGGNHDLEGIDEFGTDEANLEAYLSILGKETPQFCHQVAEKVLLVGLGSTAFRTAIYTSHEVSIDAKQLAWFEKVVEEHPASEGWQIFMFSHAPIIGSALRVLQTCHVVNGCCWLNHTDAKASKRFIEIVRSNSCIKAWFSGHFHLSHDYEDSITFPGGNNRGSCVFAQTGVMTARSTRDGRRHSRFLRGNSEGFEICTIDHSKDGRIRLDATVKYSDVCEIPEGVDLLNMDEEEERECSTLVFAHKHKDFDHDLWFKAYVPQDDDGCYIEEPGGTLNPVDSGKDFGNPDEVCWWHMKDGSVLGCHNGMVIEYDASTLAPLGMVVSRDELAGRRVAVIDDEWGGSALVLYDDRSNEATVVQPNEDGSYWRKVVRNKMHRMKEMRRVAAAKKWMKQLKGESEEVSVLSSYGPYTTSAGQVMGLSTRAINPKAPVAA